MAGWTDLLRWGPFLCMLGKLGGGRGVLCHTCEETIERRSESGVDRDCHASAGSFLVLGG